MARRQDWVGRLIAEHERLQSAAFSWRENNCLVFVNRCLIAVTGEDAAHILGIRFDHDTQGQAYDELVRFLGDEPEELTRQFLVRAGALLGYPTIPPAYAQRGDVGYARFVDFAPKALCNEWRPWTGLALVCMGEKWVAPGKGSSIGLRADKIAQAWRV